MEEVQVILSVKEGKGFPPLDRPIMVDANLNGLTLQTDPVPPCPDPFFGTELVWEADKKNLRRMRMSMVPVKVECCVLNCDKRKERLGYILIGLKCAQLVREGKEIKETWYKLLGLRSSYKNYAIELCMGLRVEDAESRKVKKQHLLESILQSPPLESSPCWPSEIQVELKDRAGYIQVGPPDVCVDMFQLTLILGAALNLDLLIPGELEAQVEECYFLYTVLGFQVQSKSLSKVGNSCILDEKIVVRIRSSLECLRLYFSKQLGLTLSFMWDETVFGEAGVDFQKLIPSSSDLDGLIDLLDGDSESYNEVRCALTSVGNDQTACDPVPSVNMLIKLNILPGPDSVINVARDSQSEVLTEIGSRNESDKAQIESEVSTSALGDNLHINLAGEIANDGEKQLSNDYLSQSEVRETERPRTAQSSNAPVSEDKPKSAPEGFFVNVEAAMSGDKSKPVQEPLQEHVSTQATQELPSAAGDCQASRHDSPSKSTPTTPVEAGETSGSFPNPVLMPPSDGSRPQSSGRGKFSLKGIQPCHFFSVTITVESIVLHDIPETKTCKFKFYHPKVDISASDHPTVIVEPMKTLHLRNIRGRLNFLSSEQEMNRVLLSWPPEVYVNEIIHDSPNLIAQASLDMSILLSQKKYHKDLTDDQAYQSCNFLASLESSGSVVGSVGISVVLEDFGSDFKQDDVPYHPRILSGSEAVPLGLDPNIVYKIVEELEDWKDKQQEIFKEQLKKKEQDHLTALTSEWVKRCEELELNFQRGVAQCNDILGTLEGFTSELKEKGQKASEQEVEVSRLREELDRKYSQKLQDLREASQRLENDVQHKLSQTSTVTLQLEEKITRLEQENKLWREKVKHLDDELEKAKRSMLSEGETSKLLQELRSVEAKLANANNTKYFFKQQWSRAVREIHRLKYENQEAIQVKLKQEREELKKLGLEGLIREEEQGLKQDEKELQKLHEEVRKYTDKKYDSQPMNHGPGALDPQQLYKIRRKYLGLHSANAQQSSEYGKQQSASNVAPKTIDAEQAEERISQLIGERDSLLQTGHYEIDDPIISKLNQEIRFLLTEPAADT